MTLRGIPPRPVATRVATPILTARVGCRCAASAVPRSSPLGLPWTLPDPRPGSSCSPYPCRTVRDSSPKETAVLSTHAVTPEQVGVGSGRRGKDRRVGQPGRQRRGPGWGRPGLRRGATVSPSLRPPAAVAAAQLPNSGVASAASRAVAAAPLRTPADHLFPATSPWLNVVYRYANGQCVSLHPMLTLAKLPEIFSTKDLVSGW